MGLRPAHRMAIAAVLGVAAVAVPSALVQGGVTSGLDDAISLFFWGSAIAGLAAGVAGGGWRGLLAFATAILLASTVSQFILVPDATLGSKIAGSVLIFLLAAVPGSGGWGLATLVVGRLLRRG